MELDFTELQLDDQSDINEHLMTLYFIAKEFDCKNILELGVRTGKSTTALLKAASEIGGHLISIDINDCNIFEDSHWTFIQSDDLDVDWNEPIDLLFIDAKHTYSHLTAELEKFEPFVGKDGFIIIHDITNTHDKNIEGKICGAEVMRAVDDYFSEKPYKWFNNFGLAVIRK